MKIKNLLALTLMLAGCINFRPRSELETVQECLNYLHTNIAYVGEASGEDYWQAPEETARLGTGDCEDEARYLQRLLSRNQVESRRVYGRRRRNDRFAHVWLECEINGQRYIIDPVDTCPKNPNDIPEDMYIRYRIQLSPRNGLQEYIRRTGDREVLNELNSFENN